MAHDVASMEWLKPLVWGDLAPPDEAVVTVAWTISRNDRLLGTDCGLSVSVKPHDRPWKGRWVLVQGFDREISYFLPDKLVLKTSDIRLDVEFEFALWLKRDLPTKMAPRLYEADPRIGMRMVTSGGLGACLKCPLFDPPGGVQPPTPFSDRHIGLNPEYFDRWTRCRMCDGRLVEGQVVIWGGGHLLWVCLNCGQ